MKGLNIYRLMLRSWLRMLYREKTSHDLVEVPRFTQRRPEKR